MDKIKTVKIKNNDGTISEETYTISVDAMNVDMENGKDLQETIGTINKELINIDNGLDDLNKNSAIGKIIFGKNSNNLTKSGDFCFIKTLNKIIMIDTHRADDWASLVECMKKYQITHIDVLIITHFHGDHTGNISNLCSNNYLDNNTTVYAQSNDTGWNIETEYNSFMNCVNTYHLNYIVPDKENQTIIIDDLCSIRFNNIDPSYWTTHYNGNNTRDYNDTSFILSITYGNVKFLTGGDAGKMPFLKMVEEGYINESYNLFKIEHHGINNTANAIPFEVMSIINPEYTIQTSSSYETIDTIDNETSCKYQEVLGFKNIVTGYNRDFVCFDISKNGLVLNNGNSMVTSYGNNINRDIYIDCNAINTIMDGTSNYPFKDLPQAMANLNPNFSGTITIHLADGTYSTKYTASNNKSITKICGYKSIINIIGNTEDNTKVILKNGFIIKNSNVNISNLTITNYNTNRCINCLNANIVIKNCIIKSLENTTTSNGIYIDNCKLSISSSDMSYYATCISSFNSIVDSYNITFENCSYGYYNSHSILNIKNNTIGLNVTKYINSVDNSSNTYLNGVVLYKDNTGATEITFDNNIDISKFNYLEIEITDGQIIKNIKVPKDFSNTIVLFEFLSSDSSFIYEKMAYLNKPNNSNEIKVTRIIQKRTNISNGNVLYTTEGITMNITEIIAY